MARTSKPTRPARPAPGPQAPPGVWSPSDLLEAIRKPSRARKIELLRDAGILDARGKLAKKYRSWGSRVSRTESA